MPSVTTGRSARSSPRSSRTSASRSSKFVAFLLTGAASLLAEAIHSLADTGNQGLLLLGAQAARQAGRRRASVRVREPCATSGRSSSRSCCSAWAACSRSSRASRSCAIRTSSRTSASRSACCVFAIVLERFSFRTALVESQPSARPADDLVAVHPAHEEPRAAGRAARGHRRADRARDRAVRRAHGARDRRAPLGRGRQPRDRHPARRRSRSSSRIEMASLLLGEAAIARGHRRRCRVRSRHMTVRRQDHPPAHRAHRPRRHRARDQGRVRSRA